MVWPKGLSPLWISLGLHSRDKNPLISPHMQHAGNVWASGLSQNRPYTRMLSGLRSIRQLDWIHLKIVLFVSLYTPTATTGIIVVLQFAFCVRRRNMTHSSLSPNTTKTGCTRSNLNPHSIQFNAMQCNSMQKKTSKVLLLGLENPDDGNKSFSCFVHDRDWKVKHYCHLLSA